MSMEISLLPSIARLIFALIYLPIKHIRRSILLFFVAFYIFPLTVGLCFIERSEQVKNSHHTLLKRRSHNPAQRQHHGQRDYQPGQGDCGPGRGRGVHVDHAGRVDLVIVGQGSNVDVNGSFRAFRRVGRRMKGESF